MYTSCMMRFLKCISKWACNAEGRGDEGTRETSTEGGGDFSLYLRTTRQRVGRQQDRARWNAAAAAIGARTFGAGPAEPPFAVRFGFCAIIVPGPFGPPPSSATTTATAAVLNKSRIRHHCAAAILPVSTQNTQLFAAVFFFCFIRLFVRQSRAAAAAAATVTFGRRLFTRVFDATKWCAGTSWRFFRVPLFVRVFRHTLIRVLGNICFFNTRTHIF